MKQLPYILAAFLFLGACAQYTEKTEKQAESIEKCKLSLSKYRLVVVSNKNPEDTQKYELWLPNGYFETQYVCGTLISSDGIKYNMVSISDNPLHLIMNPGIADGGLELIFLKKLSGKVNIGSIAGPLPIATFTVHENST